MKTPYTLALSDRFHPPVIHRVELQDGTVRIRASDDVCVAQVTVIILNEAGNVVQQGPAVQAQPDRWSFTSTPPLRAGCKVVVEAQDLASKVTIVAIIILSRLRGVGYKDT